MSIKKQHKQSAYKEQPRVDISTAKDKEEKPSYQENEAGHEHEHGGFFRSI